MTDEELQAKAPALASTHKLRERVAELEALNAELVEACKTALGCLDDPTGGQHEADMYAAKNALRNALAKTEGITE